MTNNPLEQPLMQIYRTIVSSKPEIIDGIGTEALKFIDDNFAKGGFQGATFVPWEKRKKREKGASRKILVQTAALRRSPKKIDYPNHTTISTDIPYAQIHNEGGTINMPSRSVILSYRGAKGGKLKLARRGTGTQQRRATVGAHVIRMSKRQFIGPSPVLDRACEKVILKIISSKIPQ